MNKIRLQLAKWLFKIAWHVHPEYRQLKNNVIKSQNALTKQNIRLNDKT